MPDMETTPPGTVYKKEKFASELKPGDSGDEVFVLSEASIRKMKKGQREYWALTLSDRTGKVEARCWEPKGGLPPAGAYVKVRYEAENYRGEIQAKVSLVRELRPDEAVAFEDFVPVGPNDRYRQIEKLLSNVTEIAHPGIRSLLAAFFADVDLYQGLRDAPAATKNHHAYVGGLVQHVTNLVGLSLKVEGCNQSLLVAASVLHDIGKIREMSWRRGLSYTVEGELIGHVYISLSILDTLAPAYWRGIRDMGVELTSTELEHAQQVLLHLRHIVASHHGRREWGALAVPATREAVTFHLLDMQDSRAGFFDSIEEMPVDERGFTTFQKPLDTRAWLP